MAMAEPLLQEALLGWRVYEALARHADPPVPLPPREELLAWEAELLEKPLSELTHALRSWALGRNLGDPPLPRVVIPREGVLELRVPDFRPYPFVFGFSGQQPLYFGVRGRTVRHSLRVSRRGVLFGREKGVPVPFLSRVDELYSPIVLPLFELEVPGGVLGEALRKKVRLDWGAELFRQGSVYLTTDPARLQVRVWDSEEGTLQGHSFSREEDFAGHLYQRVLEDGPLFLSAPSGPLKQAIHEEDEVGLDALRSFSDLLSEGFQAALEVLPEVASLLPRFLPDGRWLRVRVEGARVVLWKGKRPVKRASRGEGLPPEDPFLAMRTYWDLTALEMSAGCADLLEVAPQPLVLPGKVVLFARTWATVLSVDTFFAGSGV